MGLWLQWVLSSGADLRIVGVNIFEGLPEANNSEARTVSVSKKTSELSREIANQEGNTTERKEEHDASDEGDLNTKQSGANKTEQGNNKDKHRDDKKPDSSNSEAAKPEIFELIYLYQLAEYLGSEACCNAVVDEIARIAEHFNAIPNAGDTQTLWADDCMTGPVKYQAEGGRGLKGLVIDLFVTKKADKLLLDETDSWFVLCRTPADFIY